MAEQLPTTIQGPAIVKRGTLYVYFENGLQLSWKRPTWMPSGSVGDLGERAAGYPFGTLSGKPTGLVSVADGKLNMLPLGPADIGKKLLSATPIEVIPLEGLKHTYAYTGILKMPSMKLAPNSLIYDGDMEFGVIGDPAKEATAADYYFATAATAADTNFDETKALSSYYKGTWGATYTDFDVEDGFKIEPVMKVKFLPGTWGNLIPMLESLGCVARFTPISLTEAQYATMLGLQGASAIKLGQALGSEDLVIAGTGLTATFTKMGPGDGGLAWDVSKYRQGEMVFHNKRTWTAGAGNPLWTFATV